MEFMYHATNNPNEVAMSCDQAIEGWLKPSEGLGTTIIGKYSETILTKDEAVSFINSKIAEGHSVKRGKDLSNNGAFEMKRALKGVKK